MSEIFQVSRRTFLRDVGKGTLAVAVLGIGVVACSSDSEGSTNPATTTGADPDPTTTSADTSTTTTTSVATPAPADGAVTWERVVLGSVSAYLLARGTEVAIVDTGNTGDAPEIEASLATIGLGWSNVGHVILTHRHPDHQGSLIPVMEAATAADAYAGEADIPSISSPRAIIAVGDDDQVFGLDIIETPGHTDGHISVFDSAGGLLVAGDSLNGANGGVAGPNPTFSTDQNEANESAKKMANLQFETLVFGHGDPVVGGADTALATLAATL